MYRVHCNLMLFLQCRLLLLLVLLPSLLNMLPKGSELQSSKNYRFISIAHTIIIQTQLMNL